MFANLCKNLNTFLHHVLRLQVLSLKKRAFNGSSDFSGKKINFDFKYSVPTYVLNPQVFLCLQTTKTRLKTQ